MAIPTTDEFLTVLNDRRRDAIKAAEDAQAVGDKKTEGAMRKAADDFETMILQKGGKVEN